MSGDIRKLQKRFFPIFPKYSNFRNFLRVPYFGKVDDVFCRPRRDFRFTFISSRYLQFSWKIIHTSMILPYSSRTSSLYRYTMPQLLKISLRLEFWVAIFWRLSYNDKKTKIKEERTLGLRLASCTCHTHNTTSLK